MRDQVIFWGATGHAKVLREQVDALGYRIMAVFDNNPAVPPPFEDVPLLYGTDGWAEWRRRHPGTQAWAIAAIAGARGRDRLKIQRWLNDEGFAALTLVHPRAYVARGATIGAGVHVSAGAHVCAECVLEDGVIVNTLANIDHECVLREGVHVSSGAVISGRVEIGARTFVGVGAVVLPRVSVGADAIIGAGAIVTRDVPDDAVVFGAPARVAGRASDRDWRI